MKIVIPEYKTLEVDRLFLDFNGTIAVDGIIPAGVRQRLEQLAAEFTIYVLTADTNGNAKEQCQGLPVILQTFPTGNARDYKKELVKATGSRRCVAVGNGRNDELMLREAALSIAIMDREGAYGRVLREADLCVRSMQDGLDLLLYPNRIIAGLRG
ncbi:MAG TPA: ATPase P [Candidatus Bariatricus faecipullorum]|nr:ATPase P [Candidatus Bariatricus faecipullorum]